MIGDVLQPTHLIFILVVALLVLGPKRLPEVGRSLGRGIRDFRGALSGADEPSSPPAEAQPSVEPELPPMTPATTTVPVDHSASKDEESLTTVAVPFGDAAEEEEAAGSAPLSSTTRHTVEGSVVEHEEADAVPEADPPAAAAAPRPVAPAGDRPSSRA